MQRVYLDEMPKGMLVKTSDLVIIGTGEGVKKSERKLLQKKLQMSKRKKEM